MPRKSRYELRAGDMPGPGSDSGAAMRPRNPARHATLTDRPAPSTLQASELVALRRDRLLHATRR